MRVHRLGYAVPSSHHTSQIQDVPDLSQLSSRRLASADLAIYVYEENGNDGEDRQESDESGASSIDHLVHLRETASAKLIDKDAIVVGLLRPDTVDGQLTSTPTARSGAEDVQPCEAAIEFCQAARLNKPVLVDSTNPSASLRNVLRKELVRS